MKMCSSALLKMCAFLLFLLLFITNNAKHIKNQTKLTATLDSVSNNSRGDLEKMAFSDYKDKRKEITNTEYLTTWESAIETTDLINDFNNSSFSTIYYTSTSSSNQLPEMCSENITRDPLKYLTWPETIINGTARPKELCLKSDGTSVTRKCNICKDNLPCWDKFTDHCTSLYSETSNDLITLLNSNRSSSLIIKTFKKIVKRNIKLIPNDVHLIAEVINKLSWDENDPAIKGIIDVISLVMEADLDVLKLSQKTTNSSNVILASLDKLLAMIASTTTNFELTNRNLAIKILTLKKFNDDEIIAFYKTSPITIKHYSSLEYLDYVNLAVAVVFPKMFIRQIFSENPKLAMATFKQSSLFIETNRNYFKSVSWIPSPFVVNYTGIFSETFKIIYKTNRNYRQNKFCSFWNWSGWKNESVASEMFKNIHVCYSQHMTHFALLMGGLDNKVLDIVSSVGCTFSIVGCVGVLLTAIFYKTWRNEKKAQIPINLCLVVIVQMVFLFFLDLIDSEKDEELCLVFGIVLHYSLLCQFCWLLIVTYLHYQRFVIVFLGQENFFLLKCYLIAYGVPLVPLCVTLIFLFDDYLVEEYCYISGSGLLFGVLVPVGFIISINSVIFISIFKNLPKKNKSIGIYKQLFWQLRLLFSFFFVSGFSWLFGFLSRLLNSIAFSYCFCLTATLQGFMIFMCFIVFNSKNRKWWRKTIFRDMLKRYDSNTTRQSLQISSNHI